MATDYYNNGNTTVGAEPPLRFNSKKFADRGVVKPSDHYTLAVFRELQTQLNRLAKAKGMPGLPPSKNQPEGVDGDIGPNVMNLAAMTGVVPMGTTALNIAKQANVLSLKAQNMADALSAPPAAAPPPVATTLVTPGGETAVVPAAQVPASPAEAPQVPAARPVEVLAPGPERPVEVPMAASAANVPDIPAPMVMTPQGPAVPAALPKKPGGGMGIALGIGAALFGGMLLLGGKKGRKA